MESEVVSIAHVIQLSVAPVFLLTGVAAILGVLTNRLGRSVDRARVLENQATDASAEKRDNLLSELKVQTRRLRIIYLAMALCALCALLISGVIVVLFAGAFMEAPVSVPIAVLFVTAILAFIGALIAFLREVHLATTQVRIGLPTGASARSVISQSNTAPRR